MESEKQADDNKASMLNLPDGVVDIVEYKKYVALSRLPILNKGRKYQSIEDDDLVIDLARFDHHIKQLISHLSAEEQEHIIDQKAKYRKALGQMNMAKRKAFGNKLERGLKNTFLEQRMDDVIELFGRMFDIQEVTQIINEEWNTPVSKATVSDFRQKYFKEIEQRQERYKNNYQHLRLTHKTSRLEEMSYLYQTAKMRYKESESIADYNLMLRTMEQIRKEIEGDRLTINGVTQFKFDDELKQHMQNEIFSKLVLKEIILGRFAARMNTSVERLVSSLNRSYYAKFMSPEIKNSEILYPSMVNYDFNKIERFNRQRNIEEAEEVKEEVKEFEEKVEERSNADNIKRILKAKIQQKQMMIKERANKINADVEAVKARKE